MSVGISSITFFGPDGSTQSYFDDTGMLRYERHRNGAEFVFAVHLSPSRAVNVRVVAFESERSLADLEKDAYTQLTRILQKLGEIGEELAAQPDAEEKK